MHVRLAAVADYANVSTEGKLNIMGVFDRVIVAGFPAQLPQMQLVLRLGAEYVELDRSHRVEVTLQDPDGKRLMQMGADMRISGGRPGRITTADHILTLANLAFERAGGHTFNIFINNDLKQQVAMEVELMPQPDAQRELGAT